MKASHMNLPPREFVRVSPAEMEAFIATSGRAVGLPQDKADLLARLLVGNDLRGVFSHGSRLMANYVPLMRDGALNSDPKVHVVRETEQSLLVDGDGGLGYFAAYEGTRLAIEKATAHGMAVVATRNHGHIGAAGIYARMTLEHDLLGFVTSGHQLQLEPGQPLTHAAGGSPFAFASPAEEEDSLVLDFGTMHDLYDGDAYHDDLVRMVPGLVFRHIGMGAICQSWGGFLAGVPFDPTRAKRRFAGAYQGSLLVAFRISLFTSPEQFKSEMDAYVRAVHDLKPLPGFQESYLPGGVEAAREREYGEEGIPIGREHRCALGEMASRLGLAVPWA